MIQFGLVFLMVLALTQAKALTSQDSVQVTLYYETLCPYCVKFITEQLHNAYQALGPEKIKLELIPWGLVKEVVENGTTHFSCQHGPPECYGNKIHACALGLFSIELAEQLVYCTESLSTYSDPPESALQKCADDSGTPWSDIKECLSDGRGDKFLSVYQKKTIEAKFLDGVPTIVLDGKYDAKEEAIAYNDLKGAVCEKLGNPKECKQ